MRRIQLSNRGGFALVITLITIVLLTIMAVAFLASSSLDQTTARAFANHAKAQLAARTAVNAAVATLVENFSTYSDSATAWDRVPQVGSVQYEGTTFYYRQQSPDATAGGTPPPMYALPLISGARPVLIPPGNRDSSLSGALPAVLDNTNSFDLNHARYLNDTQGAIGAPTGATRRPEFRAQWINQTDSNNKVTSRYAYWMEDESFKANVNLMGVTPRGSNTAGNDPSQIPMQGLFKALGIANFDSVGNAIFSSRSNFPGAKFFEYRAIDHVAPTRIADDAKFESTIFSGAMNLSRTGTKRINLNRVVSTTTDPTEIRKQLDEIINTIKYESPNFGQRFYRNGSDLNALDVPVADQTIYLNKIAANIRDYIDTDSQPTIVNDDAGFTVSIGVSPTDSLPGGGTSGPNPAGAIGKDAVPLMQEYMLRVKQIEPRLKSPLHQPADYHIEIDHYVEFWNMTNKDITVASLGPAPFLRIANQFPWTSYGGTDIPEDPGRDFSIPLSSFSNANGESLVFAAGTATVLTTDPAPVPSTLSGVDPARIFRPPAGTPGDSYRVYTGTCNAKTSTSYPHLDAQPRPNNSSNAGDLWTEVILGNSDGILESFGAPTVWYVSVNADDGTQSRETKNVDTTKYFFRASSLKGNSPDYAPTVSQTGDPRTNNEQLSLDSSSLVGDDQTSYKTELRRNSPPSPTNNDASLTQLNSLYVYPTLWVDPAMPTADAAHAPAVIANAALTSIGQLGDIFDPSRPLGVSNSIKFSRGGGRTFKIGQSDDLWDDNSNSASREWTSWRLADMFSSSALALVQLDGRINVNGISRDAGAAFTAALYGYVFQPTPLSGPQIADATLSDAAIQMVVDQLKARLSNDRTTYSQFSLTSGPLFERGEVSELPIFDSGTELAGVDMTKVYDRGREEVFRRIADLLATRGNIFTVYAVGQSLIPPQAGSTGAPIVTATSESKVTFRIDPVWTTGTPVDPFDPSAGSRFRKPDTYAIQILYAGD